MSRRNDDLLLRDMLDSISKINAYTSQIGKEEFLTNVLVQDAVIRNFVVLGEASNRLSKDFRYMTPR